MIKGIESVNLFTEDAKKLASFYREKVGLKQTFEGEMGEDNANVYGFEFDSGPGLMVVDHKDVKDTNSDPSRIIFNLEVDNIETEVKRLDDAGVKKITATYHIEGYGYIATFEDADGNYFQLAQVRANG